MKVYQIMYDGDTWQATGQNIYLQLEDALVELEKVRRRIAEDARMYKQPDDSDRFRVEEFNLIGSWIDL